MARSIFISYSSKDSAVAQELCRSLEEHNLTCWIAPRDINPGADWGSSLVEGIRDAKVMILILSPHSNTSPQVFREVERAVHFDLPIIPVRIENIPPSSRLEYFLSTCHWLDAYEKTFAEYLGQIANAVRIFVEAAGAPAATDPTNHQPSVGCQPSEEIREKILAELTKYVGPIAGLLLEQALQQHAGLPTALAALAEQIPSPAQKTTFSSFCKTLQSTSPPPAPAPPAMPKAEFSEETLAQLERELRKLLGPIAPLIVRKNSAISSSYQNLCDRLCLEIKSQTDRQLFVKNIADIGK